MPERQYRIHPAIGIARVGDAARSDASNDFYFIGPEIPEFAANIDPQSGVQGEFKTPDGKVKPQAARFRIFEYEKGNDGKFRPIGEVRTSDNTRAVKIVWTAHLANRKANFCAFHGQAGAEDNPLFASYGTPQNPRLKARNDKVKTSAERKKSLELDPGLQSVNGGDTVTVAHFAIDHDLKQNKPSGETKLKIRTLGELRSNADGHLIVIGGMGQSDFDPGLGRETIQHFANNDGWFDDMSDGPVDAELTIDGAKQQVAGAWVVVGPPDFVPPIRSYRTMYDSLTDVIVREMDVPTDDGLFAGPLAHIAAMNDDWKSEQDDTGFQAELHARYRADPERHLQDGTRTSTPDGSSSALSRINWRFEFQRARRTRQPASQSRRSFRTSARSKYVRERAETANISLTNAGRIWRLLRSSK